MGAWRPAPVSLASRRCSRGSAGGRGGNLELWASPWPPSGFGMKVAPGLCRCQSPGLPFPPGAPSCRGPRALGAPADTRPAAPGALPARPGPSPPAGLGASLSPGSPARRPRAHGCCRGSSSLEPFSHEERRPLESPLPARTFREGVCRPRSVCLLPLPPGGRNNPGGATAATGGATVTMSVTPVPASPQPASAPSSVVRGHPAPGPCGGTKWVPDWTVLWLL